MKNLGIFLIKKLFNGFKKLFKRKEVVLPPMTGSVDFPRMHIQYTGEIDWDIDAEYFNVDMFDTPKERVEYLQSRGVKVIAYFSSQYEHWRPDAKDWPEELLGENLDGWEGERWVDINNSSYWALMKNRIKMAKEKGFDVIDLDNIDQDLFKGKTGFDITRSDIIRFVEAFAIECHNHSIRYFQKNGLNMIETLSPLVDGYVNEQCIEYNEWHWYDKVKLNKPVFCIEYKEPSYIPESMDVQIKNLKLDGWFDRRS